MNPKISIIIPVYNAEQYLPECIDSIRYQTLTDFEVILINDGSTDRSAEVCKKYARIDSRVRFIDQSNQGVCMARNAGLDAATGTMITFVDSDDWMSDKGLELLHNEYERTDADLIIANMGFAEKNKTRCIYIFDKEFTTEDKSWINKYEMACIGYGYNPNPGTEMNIIGLGSMGNKLYKREIIEKYGLRFDPYTLGIYEDNLFVLNYLEHTNKVSYIMDFVYYYRKVDDSNSRGYNANTLKINDRIFDRVNEFIKTYKGELSEDFRKALYIYIIRRLEVSLSVYFFAIQNERTRIEMLSELHSIIHKEPYRTAIRNVDWKLLNPKNHRWTWATARTGSAFLMWCGFKIHLTLRKMFAR